MRLSVIVCDGVRSDPNRRAARLGARLVLGVWAVASLVAAAPSSGLAQPALLRGPYLQMATPTSVVVRWRTDVLTESRVSYGPCPNSLTETVTVGTPTAEHEVPITGLDPFRRYYYSVGTTTLNLAGGDVDHYFVTSPEPGTRQPIRIWVIGDSGSANATAAQVRDAYLSFVGSDPADVWLMLGDNAYNTGTDAEYTAAVFDMYPQILRNTVLWPSPGNHEFGASDSPTQSGPYYVAFTMPTMGEAGGEPSGTEAYYSYDYGNVHFIALDSHDTSRTAPQNPTENVCPPRQGGAMYQWLCADLATTDKDWVIAYWHHPPYSKGSHNSDTEAQLIQMRERFVTVLEHHGVDLQLSGHSHSYERSMLIDGHYGLSGTFDELVHALDTGDGDPSGDGPYQKATLGAAPHEGAVYSVVGSSSRTSGGSLDHPIMKVSLNLAGSMVIDIDGHQLDAYWIQSDGTIRDHFRLLKGAGPAPRACSDGVDNDGDQLADYPTDPGCANPTQDFEDPACDDDVDNDDDGVTDFPADPGCATPSQRFEDPACDDGNRCTSDDCDPATGMCVNTCGVGQPCGAACGVDLFCQPAGACRCAVL